MVACSDGKDVPNALPHLSAAFHEHMGVALREMLTMCRNEKVAQSAIARTNIAFCSFDRIVPFRRRVKNSKWYHPKRKGRKGKKIVGPQ